jgi:uncharacterized protein
MIFDGLNFWLLVCAFAMGFLVPRGTTCAVAAVIEVFDRKRAWRFAGFGLASLTSFVVLLPLAWARVVPLHFAPNIEASLLVALGGVVFGIGAALNGACVFGTLSKIVSGDTSFLFVLPGLWLGAVVIGLSDLHLSPKVHNMSDLASLTLPHATAWTVAAITLVTLWYWFARKKRGRRAAIMSGIGLSGGLLYALHPYWSYSNVVHDFAQDSIMMPIHMGDNLLPWLVMAACVGGFVSTYVAGSFKLKQPKLRAGLGSFVGGFLMAFGIVMIPGGNDGLVLSLLPSLVPAGFLAYLSMNIGISLIVASDRLRARQIERRAV